MDIVSKEYIAAARQLLRISHSHYDDEIKDLICAARADLILCGILPERANDERDSLIKRAVAVYVKAEFGLDNSDAERYRQSYETLKRHLMLSSEYITAKEGSVKDTFS